jgi:hypothetical protein
MLRLNLRLYLGRCLLPLVLGVGVTAASAQTIVINPDRAMAPITAPPAEELRISVGVNTFVPSPAGDGEQALKAQEGGRRMIYELAGRECAILRDTLASRCQLDSININTQHMTNQNFGQSRVDGYTINGTINLRIVPK